MTEFKMPKLDAAQRRASVAIDSMDPELLADSVEELSAMLAHWKGQADRAQELKRTIAARVSEHWAKEVAKRDAEIERLEREAAKS